jgi:acetyltransferase-like isoleucine patch superfamily enzyme
VHISHNCKLREGSAVVACAEISGSVEIGKETWVGPNSSVMQKISIGSACIVGIGSVVLKSVPDGAVIVGNPGRALNK